MVLRKHDLEAALHAEKQEISAGRLKEDNPLDTSENFRMFCEACRRGDLKVCQEKIMEGVNINARDRFDYTPLILVSAVPRSGSSHNAAPRSNESSFISLRSNGFHRQGVPR